MPTHADIQLKQAMAKMLPEKLFTDDHDLYLKPQYKRTNGLHSARVVFDTELLQLCWEVEKGLKLEQWRFYSDKLMAAIRDSDNSLLGSNIEARYKSAHATWQQKVEALASVKGVTISG